MYTRGFKRVFQSSFVCYGCLKDVSKTSYVHWDMLSAEGVKFDWFNWNIKFYLGWQTNVCIKFYSLSREVIWTFNTTISWIYNYAEIWFEHSMNSKSGASNVSVGSFSTVC